MRFSSRKSAFILFTVLWFLAFSALGVWQLHRRTWKHALVASVHAHMNAPIIPAPGPADWPSVADASYRHVLLQGSFLNDRETLVHASTEKGAGYWVVTPFYMDQGFIVLVNRGFVPPDKRYVHDTVEGPTTLAGRLRLSEGHGFWPRVNDPMAHQWYTRDVNAIVETQKLSMAAPYFVDADDTGSDAPIGGLTVIDFPDNHLIYALTWFALAGLSAFGGWVTLRSPQAG